MKGEEPVWDETLFTSMFVMDAIITVDNWRLTLATVPPAMVLYLLRSASSAYGTCMTMRLWRPKISLSIFVGRSLSVVSSYLRGLEAFLE